MITDFRSSGVRSFFHFLSSSISGVAFWVIESMYKKHQMRYYIRIRDIEKLRADNFSFTLPDGQKTSTPQIDWMWYNASDIFHGKEGKKKIKKLKQNFLV